MKFLTCRVKLTRASWSEKVYEIPKSFFFFLHAWCNIAINDNNVWSKIINMEFYKDEDKFLEIEFLAQLFSTAFCNNTLWYNRMKWNAQINLHKIGVQPMNAPWNRGFWMRESWKEKCQLCIRLNRLMYKSKYIDNKLLTQTDISAKFFTGRAVRKLAIVAVMAHSRFLELLARLFLLFRHPGVIERTVGTLRIHNFKLTILSKLATKQCNQENIDNYETRLNWLFWKHVESVWLTSPIQQLHRCQYVAYVV